VDRGRQVRRESPRIDANGSSARAAKIASSTRLDSTTGDSDEVGLSWGRTRTASGLGDRGVGHCIRLERSHKILMDGIERHPLHAEIEDVRLLVHWKNEPDHPLQPSF
jgi:hypothetical protein